MLGNVLKQAFINSFKFSHGLKLPPGASVITINVRYSRPKPNDNLGQTPKDKKELEKLGLAEYTRKYRQYAQYNYEEWRYPQKQKAIDISCTREVADPYVDASPAEKTSLLKSPRARLVEARNEFLGNRVIKKRVPEFHRKRFPAEAQDIYVEVHNLLNSENWTIVKKDETAERLDRLVTEHSYADMIKGLDSKTLRWRYVETLEPPRVVRIRCPAMLEEKNFYGQVTVRFYSKQALAVYDRFGRLMYGSEDSPRNVLEYVVFERHVSNPLGVWRIHAKIPSNQYREPVRRTVAVVKPKPERLLSKRWHDAEEEKCAFKWYPHRHAILERMERTKRKRRGSVYWRKRRKWVVMNVKKTVSPGMRGKGVKLALKKKENILKMRKEGQLPPPPKFPGMNDD